MKYVPSPFGRNQGSPIGHDRSATSWKKRFQDLTRITHYTNEKKNSEKGFCGRCSTMNRDWNSGTLTFGFAA